MSPCCSKKLPDGLPEYAGAKPNRVRTVTLFLIVLAFWMINHPFDGIGGDGTFYAAQALARLHPSMRTGDLFFAYGSQDDYSIFGPIYARAIDLVGFKSGTEGLLYLAHCIWLGSCALLFRAVLRGLPFWLALGTVSLMPGYYGPEHLLSYAERWLTARTWAEPAALAALAAAIYGRRRLMTLLSLASCAIHPVMAFPAMVLIFFLAVRVRLAITLTAAALACVAAASLLHVGPSSRYLNVIDPQWLTLVKMRSPFIFITEWSMAEFSAPLYFAAVLVIAYRVAAKEYVRNLWGATLAAQALCLGLAALSCIWPIAILVQMQPWRVMWLINLLGTLCLVWLVWNLWQTPSTSRANKVIAGGLSVSWLLLDSYGGGLAALLAIFFIANRNPQSLAVSPTLRKAGILAIGLLALVLASDGILTLRIDSHLTAMAGNIGPDALSDAARDILRGHAAIVAPLVLALAWYAAGSRRTRAVALSGAVGLAALAFLVLDLKSAKLESDSDGINYGSSHKGDQIPHYKPPSRIVSLLGRESLVYMENGATYAWFNLNLPHYASRLQMAGLVFSRETALEAKRRSDVLAPLHIADTEIPWTTAWTASSADSEPRSPDILMKVCEDPILDFLILARPSLLAASAQFYPFGPDNPRYYVYDCRNIRIAKR